MSIFGPQARSAQLPYGLKYDRPKIIKQHEQNKINKEEVRAKREQALIDRYINTGYDPRRIFEDEEFKYKEAVRILTPIDV